MDRENYIPLVEYHGVGGGDDSDRGHPVDVAPAGSNRRLGHSSRKVQRASRDEAAGEAQFPRRRPSCDEAADEEACTAKSRQRWLSYQHLVIAPDRGSKASTWLGAWELVLSVLIMACAYFIPFNLALPEVAPASAYVFNLVLDCCFTTDIALQFVIAYRNANQGHSESIWERNPRKIARRYCAFPFSEKGEAGWFWLDLCSVLPGWMEIFMPGSWSAFTRSAKFFRLLRMARLMRMARTIERWHAATGFPFYVSDTLKFVFITTLACHWATCLWVIIEGKVTKPFLSIIPSDKESWLSALIAAKGDSCYPEAEKDPTCVYTLAFYWAMMTLTTVGYGDITPQNQKEYVVCSFYMLFAGFVWAYIVGSVVSLLSSLDPHGVKFKQGMDELNGLMDQRDLPDPLRFKLREYMLAAKDVTVLKDQADLLETSLSSGLQREVVLQTPVTAIYLEKVYWAEGLEQDALLEIMRSLKPAVYGPNERIHVRERMVIVREGILIANGRVLGRNAVYGESSILLSSDVLIQEEAPRTLSYVSVLALTRESLVAACMHFPQADQRLRRAQVRTAVWRAFVKSADVQKRCAAQGSAQAARNSRRESFASAFVADGLGPDLPGCARPAGRRPATAEALQSLELRLSACQEALGSQLHALAEDVAQVRAAVVPETKYPKGLASAFRRAPP